MSVHGEYARALENVIAVVEMLEPAAAAPHREALLRARLDHQPDLSSAARTARAALRDLSAIDVDGERLPTVAAHLDAHCRAILGLPPGDD